jgi:glyoxylase-like metal-dependent hydrolase (beta-lactamase superfamily II)
MRSLLVALVLVPSFAASQSTSAPGPFVREGVTVQLGPHTWAIPDGGIGGVPNVGIVVGERATLVIDPGLGRLNGEAVLREVAKVSSHTEVYIATTHYHPEHTTGYVAFPAGAKYLNSTTQETEFAENGAQFIRMFAARSAIAAELLRDAVRRTADITFEREYTLDLGGVRVRCLLVGPTHTRGDTVFFVEEDGVLFAGDVVMNESFLAANQNSSMRAWLAAFDLLEAMRPRTIVPAHGAVGPGTLIAANRVLMSGIQARVRALKAQGLDADAVAATIQAEYQALHRGWPRANGLAGAARSAFAEAP